MMLTDSAFVTHTGLPEFNESVVKLTKDGFDLEQLSTCWSPAGVVYTAYFTRKV